VYKRQHFITALIAEMAADATVDATTPVLRCDAESYARFKADRAAGRVGATTAVFGADRRALYFSKEVLPYLPSADALTTTPVFHHVGVYAYRPPALRAYAAHPLGPLEAAEGLEQLRFLEAGRRMSVVEVDAGGAEFWELNNPGDVAVLEAMLAARR